MAAALRNSALVEHHNLVRMTDSGKTVRNNQRGASYRQLVELLLYLLLSNIVERACSLIQHYYRRVFEEDTRNRQTRLVQQDVFLFGDSVRYNIAYAKPAPTAARII